MRAILLQISNKSRQEKEKIALKRHEKVLLKNIYTRDSSQRRRGGVFSRCTVKLSDLSLINIAQKDYSEVKLQDLEFQQNTKNRLKKATRKVD